MSSLIEYISTLDSNTLLSAASKVEKGQFSCDGILQLEDNLYSVTNRLGKKKCIAIVMARIPETAILRLMNAVVNYITSDNYLDRFDCYSPYVIDEKEKIAITTKVQDEYSVDLKIIDASMLATFSDSSLHDFFPDELIPESEDDETQRFLYEILCSGHDSTDIKMNIIKSVIVVSIYEHKNSIQIDKLQTIAEDKLGKRISNFQNLLQKLGGDQRIRYDKDDRNIVHLSELEYTAVQGILEESRMLEAQFRYRFKEILQSHSINNVEECFVKLLELYSSHFDFSSGNEYEAKFKSFKSFLSAATNDNEKADGIIAEIRELCDSNPYLNRICASNSFIGLYKSNSLEKYVKQKQNCVFLDTPLIVYLICYKSLVLTNDLVWHDSQFRSTRSLYELSKRRDCGDVFLYTTNDYINEVFGELKKAFQISWVEKFAPVDLLIRANNTFYNFYRYLLSIEDVLDITIGSFEDFVRKVLCITSVSFESNDFETITRNNIRNMVDNGYGISVVQGTGRGFNIEEEVKYYETTLKKDKSRWASISDTKTLLFLSSVRQLDRIDSNRDINLYLATWDRTFEQYQAHLQERGAKNEISIASPAKIVNDISMAFFNIDTTCITNEIFYADRKYGITANVKAFVNKITSLLEKKENGDNAFFRAVFEWYNEQVNLSDYDSDKTELSNHVEQLLLALFDTIEKQFNPDEREILVSNANVGAKMKAEIKRIKDAFSESSDVSRIVGILIDSMKDSIKENLPESKEPRMFAE